MLEDNITCRLPLGRIGRWLMHKAGGLFTYRHNVIVQGVKQISGVSMKILLVGATGLIGQALKPFLSNSGHQVVQLIRDRNHLEKRTLFWDPEKGTITPKELEAFDAVINLAGENIGNQRWNEKKKKRILVSRVKTTRLLADTLAFLDQPPKIWLNASACGYYGNQGAQELTEESPPGLGFLAHVCSEWEQAVTVAQKRRIRVVMMRFGVVLSPKGGILKRLLLPFKMGLGGKIGRGEQYMSWIAIDDILGAVAHLLTHEALEGPVNVVTPHPVSNQTFTKTLGRVLKRPTIFPLPASLAQVFFGKEMTEEMLLSSTRVLPKKLLNTGYSFTYPKLETALRHLLGRYE